VNQLIFVKEGEGIVRSVNSSAAREDGEINSPYKAHPVVDVGFVDGTRRGNHLRLRRVAAGGGGAGSLPQGTHVGIRRDVQIRRCRHGSKFVILYRAQDAPAHRAWAMQKALTAYFLLGARNLCYRRKLITKKDGGVEDPRLQRFGDTYYLTYTGTQRRAALPGYLARKNLIPIGNARV